MTPAPDVKQPDHAERIDWILNEASKRYAIRNEETCALQDFKAAEEWLNKWCRQFWPELELYITTLCSELARKNERAEKAETSVAVLAEAAEAYRMAKTADECDKTSAHLEEVLANLPAAAQALLDRLKKAEANQRTPGTHEICQCAPERCTCTYEHQWSDCERKDCPIRVAKDK